MLSIKSVPFVDLKLQYAEHQEAFQAAIQKVCASAGYILGDDLAQFEKRFAEFTGVGDAVGVASGTDALKLTGLALGLKAGDEVLVPANTFIATAIGFYEYGVIPVPVDIDPDTYLMDLRDAKRRLTSRTRALFPVHLYGQVMDLDALEAFAQEHELLLVEDACQAHGGRWKNRRAGSAGQAGCFSFFPSKNLGAFGDGGMVVTRDPELAHRLRLIRNYGSVQKYIHEIPGTNSRLDSLQAAVLNIKLDHLDRWNRQRFNAACRYADALRDLPGCRVPVFDTGNSEGHVFHLFVLECDRRDELMVHLNDQGIQCGVHYPVPVHLHPAFKDLNYQPGLCPIAERLADKILSLPVFPEITNEQVDYVAQSVIKFYR